MSNISDGLKRCFAKNVHFEYIGYYKLGYSFSKKKKKEKKTVGVGGSVFVVVVVCFSSP